MNSTKGSALWTALSPSTKCFASFRFSIGLWPRYVPANGPARKLKVYRGCYDWYQSLGFSYVQTSTTLHVLELWFCENPNLADYDVILGTGQTGGYKPFDSAPDHATQNSQEESTTMPR
jgi:hypothetical protein